MVNLKNKKLRFISELMKEMEEQTSIADGFDDAILGVTHEPPYRVIYDYEKCIKVLMKQNKWKRDEAKEYMEFNVVCSAMGEISPLFIRYCD